MADFHSSAGHSGKNKVNEFDTDAWGSVFDAMTKEREESESAEAVSARQAAEMVTKMLEDMQEKFVGALDKMEGDLDAFRDGVGELDEKVKSIDAQMRAAEAIDEHILEGEPPERAGAKPQAKPPKK